MRLAIGVALVCGTVLVSAAAVPAELSTADKQRVETLIQQFGAKEFAARQAAVEKLIEMGPDVVPLVRKTLAETKDNEVKLRCEMVLKGITEKYGPAAGAGTPVKVNFDGSKVTLDVKDTPLAEVLEKLSEQSGNVLIRAENLQDRPVTLSVKDLPYWEAVDKVCASAGLLYVADHGRGEVALRKQGKVEDIGVCTGPFALKIDAGTLTRFFRVAQYQAGTGRWQEGNLSYPFTLFWEDRLPPGSLSVKITQALTPEGRNVAEARLNPGFVGPHPGRTGTRPVPFTSTAFNLPGVFDGIRKLTRIEGTITAVWRLSEKTLRIADILAGGEKTASADGITVTLRTATRTAGNLRVTLQVRREGTELQGSLAPESGLLVFAVEDPKGNRQGGWTESGRSGPAERRMVGGKETLVEEAEFTAGFWVQTDGPWSLVLGYADKMETREYPFVIRDVPLP